ncbi:19240_t:CDS:2, partial [Racocetra fulgida]
LTEENEKLVKENKELTEKNDELVYFIYKKQNKYQQMNKDMTELLENLDKKIDNCLTLLKINSNFNINKIDKIVLAKLQEENKIAKYQNERLTKKQEQMLEEIRLETEQYNEKKKIFDVLDEKIDIVLANFNFEVLFPLNDTLEKMEKIVKLYKISQCKDKIKNYEQNKEVNQELKNLEYDYKSLERTLNIKLEQLEKEKEINIE